MTRCTQGVRIDVLRARTWFSNSILLWIYICNVHCTLKHTALLCKVQYTAHNVHHTTVHCRCSALQCPPHCIAVHVTLHPVLYTTLHYTLLYTCIVLGLYCTELHYTALPCTTMYIHSDVSRISFRGGFKIFLEKWGYLHGAKRYAARGEATRLLGGFGGIIPRENFKKWCNLVRFREYFAKILSKK